ncbi:importin subunit alpha-2-like isoform X5 [Papaver somniferum]|uniref:importin subunit alpha-2-like isoform X5 n=1 Tax=Papaver somniferum TaxID=3469 RepID=UPI000E6FC3C1|nr:importin subunit alpha-2-like isoform X5 [Papaver somniferum]XP_026392200.1 importin subunit alpha-2-like isoform X5 [Papaver somniferum]
MAEEEKEKYKRIRSIEVVVVVFKFHQKKMNILKIGRMELSTRTIENTEVVIEQGAIPIFVALLSSPSDDVRDQTKPALPALKRLINSTDEVLTDSCWALSYMTVQMKTKLLLRLVHVTDLLSYCFTHLLLYSFNIVTGDDRHPQTTKLLQD